MALIVDKQNARLWRVRLSNAPLNLMDPELFNALRSLLDEAEANDELRVVVVESAVPDFFMAHLDTDRATEKPDAGEAILDAWDDFVDRFAKAPFTTIASLRGRVRGIGNEFLLAFDMRFASRERAILAQPEIGASVVPGGGGMDWLPRLTGRSRALEIMLGANDFDADTAERYGWINRALPDAELDGFVDTLATRISLWDREALRTIKEYVGRRSAPSDKAEIREALNAIGGLWQRPEAQKRIGRMDELGNNTLSDFELDQPAFMHRIAREDAGLEVVS